MSIVLRPYQEQARLAAWEYLRHAEGNPALVLPTGAGKSPLMAALARDAVETWQGRVGILAHVQELVEQNAQKLHAYWPGAPVGVYAAGLGRRDRLDQIIFGQIQSVAKRAREFGAFDLLLIDEAHRIPLAGDGMYLKFLDDARAMNPQLRVIGLTATPYRLQGRAVPVCGPGRLLTEIAYEARVPDLIRDGFLSRLVSKAPERPDLSAVHLRGGEYVEAELAAVMAEPELVARTVADMLARAEGRRAAIVFCVNVAHAEMVLARLAAAGERAAMVHAGTPKGERAALVSAFQAGALRWMVNVNVLSEGFDAPHIDLVAMLRPTKSPGLYYQQVGRGLRLSPGKNDCLVLDYAGNVGTHGAIDEIRISKGRDGTRQVQTGMVKECPGCGAMLALGIRECPECKHSFGAGMVQHGVTPGDLAVVSTERERVRNWHPVSSVRYDRHDKPGKPVSLRVTYQCGLRRFSEWVCIEHGGFARAKADTWWSARAGVPAPGSVNDALELAFGLPKPEAIEVDETDKFPQVLGYRFPERTEIAPSRTGAIDKAPAWLRAALGKEKAA